MAYPPSQQMQPPPPQAAGPQLSQQQMSAWQQYCITAEVPPKIQGDLCSVVSEFKIIALLDDSGSMNTVITPPQGVQFTGGQQSTRWQELKGDTAALVQLVTALNPQGIDIFFLNRPGQMGVTNLTQLESHFAAMPSGGTPMVGAIRNIFQTYASYRGKLLLVVITDGEPSDGSYNDLFNALMGKPQNFYVSFVECNDNEEEMDFLTGWDTRIPNFHNQEDYPEELRLVRVVNGPNYKFTRVNYTQMIVLSPVFRQYAIDIRTQAGKVPASYYSGDGGAGYAGGSGGPDVICCTLL